MSLKRHIGDIFRILKYSLKNKLNFIYDSLH
jgi:hypothetical protein